MSAHDQVGVAIETGNTPIVSGGAEKWFCRRGWLHPVQRRIYYFCLNGPQHDAVLPPHRCGQGFVLRGIARLRLQEEGVEHHEGATIIRQPVQQPGVQFTVPRLAADLVKLVVRVCLVVHQDEGHPVRDRARAKAEQIIVAGVHPGLTQRRLPQHQTAKHRHRRAQPGFEKFIPSDGFDLHR